MVGLERALEPERLPERGSGAVVPRCDVHPLESLRRHYRLSFLGDRRDRYCWSATSTIAESDCSVSTAWCFTARMRSTGRYTLNCFTDWVVLGLTVLEY